MALTPHEPGQHHVGLGPRGGTIYGFFTQGGYTRQLQREGNRGSTEIGGQLDLVSAAVGLSRWTQDEFEGGAYQNRSTQDKAAFSTCLNFVPQLQGVGCISTPPMIMAVPFDPLGSAYTSHLDASVTVPSYVEPKRMFNIAGSIYLVFKHGIFRYQIPTATLTFSNGNAPDIGQFLELVDAAYDQNEEIYWALLSSDDATTRPLLRRFRHDFTNPNIGTEVFQGPADTEGFIAYGLELWGPTGDIIVSIGRQLWTFRPPKVIGDDATAGTWTDIGRLPGRWIDSCSFNNRIYILCNEPDGETHVVTWDGDEILPVTTMPYNFEGREMTAYGGRLFVVGRGTDVNGGDRYGELHEITGASVRLVRTFMPEHIQGYGAAPKNFKTVRTVDGLLYFPHQGRSLIAYDLTADGFWGANEFQPGDLTNFTIHGLCKARGALYGFGSTNGVNAETGLYRVALNTDVPAPYNSILETADLDYEIGRKKRYSEIVIRARNQTSMTLEYSVDSGFTWTSLAVTAATVGDITTFRSSLAAITPSETIRFRFTFDQGTDTSLAVMELIAFTVTFALTETGKSSWSLTLLGVDQIEDWRGSQEADYGDDRTQDLATMFSTVRGWMVNQTPLTYRDVDGTDHDVQIIDYSEYLPEIGPIPEGATRPEGYLRLALQEV